MKKTKNSFLPSLELYIPQEIEIHYKRPLYRSMTHITSSETAVKHLRLFINNKRIDHKEFFWVMYLNRANRLLGFSEIGSGDHSHVVINRKEIFQLALLTSADSILVFHNHPSGQLKISVSDKKQTKKLKEMADVLTFRFLDHIIITSESYVSLAEEGYM